VSKMATIHADFLEAGCGPLVTLVHSSVSGARHWRGLIDDLKGRFQVRAVNLFGYGKTPPWAAESRQSLADQARLVEAALPAGTDQICLVGHSFGGAVAMKVAARLSRRVAKLVLLEPIPFQLLAQAGCKDAFAEAVSCWRSVLPASCPPERSRRFCADLVPVGRSRRCAAPVTWPRSCVPT
jgi:pimeloyl-ACP methyl ester carboxylesterase